MKLNLKLKGGKEIIQSIEIEMERLKNHSEEIRISMQEQESLMDDCEARICSLSNAIDYLQDCL